LSKKGHSKGAVIPDEQLVMDLRRVLKDNQLYNQYQAVKITFDTILANKYVDSRARATAFYEHATELY